jgi:hypothetical protein
VNWAILLQTYINNLRRGKPYMGGALFALRTKGHQGKEDCPTGEDRLRELDAIDVVTILRMSAHYPIPIG